MSERFQIHVPSVMMRQGPSETAEASNELLYGEIVEVLKQEGEWVRIRTDHDGYEDFIPMSVLGKPHETTTKISVPSTHIYQDPDFKSPVLSPLYMGSKITLSGKEQNGFCELAHSGWVFADCLSNDTAPDFVETALMYEHAPYIWGGRSAAGIDCSGLVQISLMSAGIDCPRDTKDQIETLGQGAESENLQRGDLVYFERHVGIMLDSENILNATSRHMKVVIEKLEDMVAAYDSGILGVRRL